MENMATPLTKNIESRIIDQIHSAKQSIHIAVAWFTNTRIMNALIDRILVHPGLSIQIVVDDNKTNQLYFFSKATAMEQVGITIKRKVSRQFLHQKFMVIDGERVMMGSYNFTEKANTNREIFVLIEAPIVAGFCVREFEMLTNPTYIDENVHLLLRYPVFTQKLISANYPFNANNIKMYRTRITIGYCFLADNGHYNELYYEPGFIFNSICAASEYEFPLPIVKDVVANWHQELIIDFGAEYYRNNPRDFEGIGDYMTENLQALETYYKRKYEHLYTLEVLEDKIVSEVNIVVEDYLWAVNFFPFINNRVLDIVMKTLPDLSENEYWKRENHLIKHKSGRPRKNLPSDQK